MLRARPQPAFCYRPPMGAWLRDNWWWIWGVGASSAYVAWRMRQSPTQGPLLRRILWALVPESNPDDPRYRPISAKSAWLIGAALVVAMLSFLLQDP